MDDDQGENQPEEQKTAVEVEAQSETHVDEMNKTDVSTESTRSPNNNTTSDEVTNRESNKREREGETGLNDENEDISTGKKAEEPKKPASEGVENEENEAPGKESIEEKDTEQPKRVPTIAEKSSTESTVNKDNKDETPVLPTRPIKKARTAYFIFAEEKRPEIQAKHPGEGVTVVARGLGQLWATLSEEEKAVYQEKAAEERERVAQELAKYNLDGIDVAGPQKPTDPNSLIFPVARIRKIIKLDPDVHNLSKEATALITKCAELATIHLGQEAVKVAQLQNRRKLMPEDVAHVCATREQFLFLREDVKDLVREQKAANQSNKTSSGSSSMAAAAANSKPLTSYFASK
mmetsp:Transcript_26809/g.39671  ORF Transcript_26809/g.39671 Transcript_26809/m.39671 type:complete len:349 (+) Transcript_26809:46-1092(+)